MSRVLAVLAFVFLPAMTQAQVQDSPWILDDEFHPFPNPTPNLMVRCTVLQSNGKLLVAADLSTGGSTIYKFNLDGTKDTSFTAPSFNQTIRTMVVLSSGKIMVGGDFTLAGATACNRLVRLNTSGSLDLTFADLNINNSVHALALQADGRILVAGKFTSATGFTHNYVARLTSLGAVDGTFNPNPLAGVYCLAVQSDGKILIGGDFLSIGGEPRYRAARLNANGNVDLTFFAVGLNSTVSTIALQADGKVLLGGSFSAVGGYSYGALARVSSSGSLDMTFHPIFGNGSGGLPAVTQIVVLGDGRMVVVGSFTAVGGQARSRVAMIGSSGAVDPDFYPALGSPGEAVTLAVQSSGKIIIGGGFSSVNNLPCYRLARFAFDGVLDRAFAPESSLANSVMTLAVQGDGKILAGGLRFNGPSETLLARFDANGVLDEAFHPQVDRYVSQAERSVSAILVQPDGRIVIGGTFCEVDGVERIGVARLLGETGWLDRSFDPKKESQGFSAQTQINAMALQADGKILVGGALYLAGGEAHALIRLNADGSRDTGFLPNVGGVVSSIVVQPDGKILVGRSITRSPNALALVRLNQDGSRETTFPSLFDLTVAAIALQRDGKILVSGYGTSSAHGPLVRLNSDGIRDNTFDYNFPLDGLPSSLLVQADGKILVAGDFTRSGTVARRGVARINADGTLDTAYDPSTSTTMAMPAQAPLVRALALQSDGKVLLGGDFYAIRGSYRDGLARYANDTPGTAVLEITTPGKVTWRRGGGASEVDRVGFEVREGSAWTYLGAGSPTSEGWELMGVSLSDAGWIRARGRSLGGQYNGSSGMVEQLLSFGTMRPVIGVEQPAGHELEDAGAGIDFGAVPWLQPGVTKTFVIRNTGTAELTGLAVTLDDFLKADFQVGALGKTVLEPEESTTVSVTFRPQGGSLSQAVLHLASNDGDRPVFDVFLTGVGVMEDPGFTGTKSNPVYSMALQADGKIIAGGNSYYNANGMRMDSGGLKDGTFAAKPNREVNALTVQPDGKILAAGAFTQISGQVCNRIARLNQDGTLDSGFAADVNGEIERMLLQADGRILIGGWFTTVNGTGRSYLARLNADGSLDGGFNQTLNGYVTSMAIQPDGNILVGGTFSLIGGVSHYRLVRLLPSGEVDASFNPVVEPTTIYDIAVQADGKILVAGSFSVTSGGKTYYELARFNPDGTLDETFASIFLPFTDGWGLIYDLALQADGKIIVAGFIAGIGEEMERRGMVRLNADGTLDEMFAPNFEGGIRSVVLQADGKILAGGTFSSVGGGSHSVTRILNNIPAGQGLTVPDATRINWLRSGSASEIERATLERWNGNGWTMLGAGRRICGGWELAAQELPEAGRIRARGYILDGRGSGIIEQSMNYNLTGAPLNNLKNWRVEHFGDAANSGPGANGNDPAGDGVSNLVKFATGQTPAVAGSMPGVLEVGSSSLTFTYFRSKGAVADGVSFVVEWSDTLGAGSWSPTGVTEEVVSGTGATDQVRATIPAGSAGKRFVRLRIVSPEE